ncbi:MAG: adenosine deaminase, partial [Archangium sp.]|nr:adenosine deaminase [Archangium sp.]
HRIPLECCPSSNLQTRAVTEMKSHPLKFYFDYGLRVTINTDNRLITDTTVSNEYWVAHKELDLSLEDITTIIISGFKSAFLPFREKQDMLKAANAEIDATLKRFEAEQRK